LGRFQAAHEGVALTPLVGREQEIGLLLERWALAQDGEGQIVLLSGEPGIGKSRVLSTLHDWLKTHGTQALQFPVLAVPPQQRLLPILDHFERC